MTRWIRGLRHAKAGSQRGASSLETMLRPLKRSDVVVAVLFLCCAWTLARPVSAQAWLPGKGNGWITLWYQGLSVHDHLNSHGKVDHRGQIHSRTELLDVGYGLTDRWTVTANIPYVTARYNGAFPEGPLDDGSNHSAWQDWGASVRYMLQRDPWVVTPYLRLGMPSHAYVTSGHTAVGQNLRQASLGAEFGRMGLGLPDLYLQGGYAYTFVEKVKGFERTNRSNVDLGFGYIATRNLDIGAVVYWQETYGGIDISAEEAPYLSPGELMNHDRFARANYVRAGLSASYTLNRSTQVFIGWSTTIWGENTHKASAYTVGFSQGFNLRPLKAPGASD